MQQIIKIFLLVILSISYIGCASSKPDPRIEAMIKKRQEEVAIRQKKQQEAEISKQRQEEELRKKKLEERKWNQFSNNKKLQQKWKDAGLTLEEALEWKKSLNPKDLWGTEYIKKGLTLTDVIQWKTKLKYNKIRIYEIFKLKEAGFTPEEAIKWKGMKFNFHTNNIVFDIPSMISWKKAGFSASEAQKWNDDGRGFTLKEAKSCMKLSFTPEEAEKKIELFRDKCSEQLKWQEAGFSSEEYIKWRKNKFNIEQATKWKKVGYEHSARWINYNRNTTNKYTPDEAVKWVSIEVFEPKEADKWKETKLKKSIIKKYRKQEISASAILKLQKVNAKPTKLALLMAEANIGMKSKKDFLNKSKILKRNHCKTIHIIHVKDSYLFGRRVNGGFHNVDEYDNKGKCYQFTGELIQRLDRKHGLVQNGNFLYHATFNQSWREGTTKIGVLKGEGAYKYITAEGSRKIIPKGKVLFFDD